MSYNYVLVTLTLRPGKHHSRIDHHSRAIRLIENRKGKSFRRPPIKSISKTVTVTLDLLVEEQIDASSSVNVSRRADATGAARRESNSSLWHYVIVTSVSNPFIAATRFAPTYSCYERPTLYPAFDLPNMRHGRTFASVQPVDLAENKLDPSLWKIPWSWHERAFPGIDLYPSPSSKGR